jgi:hypothetical protein
MRRTAQGHKLSSQLQSINGLKLGFLALQNWPKIGQKLFVTSRDFICKSLTINWLPRMDSNHDKVIQSHLSLASVASQEFRGGKPGKQKLSKISFDSFRAKFRPNRWVTKVQEGAYGFTSSGNFEKISLR